MRGGLTSNENENFQGIYSDQIPKYFETLVDVKNIQLLLVSLLMIKCRCMKHQQYNVSNKTFFLSTKRRKIGGRRIIEKREILKREK